MHLLSLFVGWDDWRFIWILKYGIFAKKKYVAVEDSKLHKIARVNFFLQCVFFPKKITNQKFWNRKLIQFKTKLAESRLLVIEENLKFCTSAGYNLALLMNHRFFSKRLSIIFFFIQINGSRKPCFPAFHRKKSRGNFRLRYSALQLFVP